MTETIHSIAHRSAMPISAMTKAGTHFEVHGTSAIIKTWRAVSSPMVIENHSS